MQELEDRNDQLKKRIQQLSQSLAEAGVKELPSELAQPESEESLIRKNKDLRAEVDKLKDMVKDLPIHEAKAQQLQDQVKALEKQAVE